MARELLTFQDWCIDTLHSVLVAKKNYRGSLMDQGYKYTLKAMVDHFASMYFCGEGNASSRNNRKEHINLWWDHLSEDSRDRFFSQLLMSKKAAEICLNKARSVNEFGGQRGLLRLEHITPNAYIYEKLRHLKNPARESVAACFRHCKLVLLTNPESQQYLDGKDAAFTQGDVDMLRDTFHATEAELVEAQGLVGEKPKVKGFGLLRMIRLHHSGVEFVDAHEKPIPPAKWLAYLNDCNNEIPF